MNLIQRYPLVSFFTLAYAIMFVANFTYIAYPTLPYFPFWVFGIFSPTISAVIVSGSIGGWPEVKRLLSGFTRWRFGWKWYLAASIMFLGSLALALVYIALGNPPGGLAAGTTIWVFLGYILYTFCSGPLSEEAGWRGFALPRLQQRFNALNSSLILGVVWTFWHVPVYYLPVKTMIPFPIFLPLTVALAILFTWIYNNTRGSLIATVLAHFGFNASGAFVAGNLGLIPPMVLYIGGGVMAGILLILVLILEGPKYLSRKPLEELPFQRI